MKHSVRFIKTLRFLVVGGLFLISCSGSNVFETRFKAAMSGMKGDELLMELFAMDQKYTNKLALKVNIGAILLALGETEKASIYLKKGEEVARFEGNKKLKSTLYTNLAELSLRQGNYAQGVEYADKSLSLDKIDPTGVVFTKAKCLYYQNDQDKAIATFEDGWSKRNDVMSKDDMNFYMSILRDKSLYAKALDVARVYGRRFDYEPGIGIIESVFYEKLGKVNESIICAAKDLEYARYTGNIDAGEELSRLTNLDKKVNDTTWNPKQQGKEALTGLISYVSDKWPEAYAGLTSAGVEEQDLPFYVFLLKSALLESGKATAKDFTDYHALEDYFRSFPNYYYHLYRGMSKSAGTTGIGDPRTAMESCILLAPDTVYAKETRIALGTALGLVPKDGAKLMLGRELDKIYALLAEGKSPRICDPVLDLRSVEDNVYTLAAVLILEKAKELPGVGDYLDKKRKASSGRLKERIEMVMNG
jgi:tetratricopeptide (TPR) repeat protein